MDNSKLAALAMLAMLISGTALAQEEAAPADQMTDRPYSVETQWTETTVGDAVVILDLHLANPPGDAYERFVQDIGYWWSRSFTMGGPATQVIMIEADPGGRLLEIYEGGTVQWAEVLHLEEGRFIGFGIPEGTFWSGAGSISVSFNEAADGGTDLHLEHRCFQQYTDEEDGAAGYAQGWSLLVGENFRRYCAGEAIEDAVIPAEITDAAEPSEGAAS